MSQINLEDSEFIESILKTKVATYSVKDGSAEGDNIAGTLKSITVSTDNGQELQLVVKYISENAPSWVYSWKVFHVEHALYSHVAPELQRFASDHGVNYSPAIPKYIDGSVEESKEYLCMEDLRPQGFRMPDKTKSLTLAEMSLVLKELAKFHAVAYAMLQLEGDKILTSGKSSVLRFNKEDKHAQGDFYVCLYFQELVKLWEERRPDLACRMKKLLPESEKLKSSTRKNTKYFTTLIHYDLWTNNVMMKYDKETGEPKEVKFLDFQLVQEGNVFQDLQYLMFTSTTPDYRKNHLESSLSIYYDEFENILQTLKCPVPQGFSKDFLMLEFKRCYPAVYIHMGFAVGIQLGDLSPVQTDETDISTKVRNMYLRSPAALERYDSITEELITNGCI